VCCLAGCATHLRRLPAPALWLCAVWHVTHIVQACQHQLGALALPGCLSVCLQELLPVALQLHTLYQPAPLLPNHAARLTRHAWAQLMASLVLAGGWTVWRADGWLGGWAEWVGGWEGGQMGLTD
jgi:hypothetical protein